MPESQKPEIQKEVTDLGLGSKDAPKGKRIINPDGSFNFVKTGIPFFKRLSFYHYLVNVSWLKFILYVLSGYVLMNTLFALIYYLMGVEHITGVIGSTEKDKFFEAFFFSSQSFTTVGYGRLAPVGFWTSTLAAFESLIGLLSLAIATGLVYGRFSRPIPKILYSKNALIAPFKDGKGFMFRLANINRSQMNDVEIRVIFSPVENVNGNPVRKFYNLKLEYSRVNFLSSVWTVNHPITESSPLFSYTKEQFEVCEVEFMILLQGFDDTFSQTVHSRYSYWYNEVVWDAKFKLIYGRDEDGNTTVALDQINDYEKV